MFFFSRFDFSDHLFFRSLVLHYLVKIGAFAHMHHPDLNIIHLFITSCMEYTDKHTHIPATLLNKRVILCACLHLINTADGVNVRQCRASLVTADVVDFIGDGEISHLQRDHIFYYSL